MAAKTHIAEAVAHWRAMSDSEMRLHIGEATAQELRTARAVLSAISRGSMPGVCNPKPALGECGVWRVSRGHSSQIVAIDSRTQGVEEAIPLIKAALPQPAWTTFSEIAFLGVVKIPFTT